MKDVNEMMKQVDGKVNGVLCLPITQEAEKKIGDVEQLEATVIDNGLVFMKSKMTTIEVVKTLEEIKTVVEELYRTLAKAAGACECDQCSLEIEDAVNIKLPQFILEDAGISKKAKLCAYTNEGSGEVTVMEAEYNHDLSDVSKETIEVLKAMGICLSGLNESLMADEIIYGDE